MKRIIFIINGTKKHNKKLTDVLSFFSNSTFFSKVETCITQYKGHAEKIAKESTSNFDYIIAVGGDGTLHEVINGININSNIKVGLLPYGTANDFARGQNLQFNAQYLFNLIKNESYKTIDIGIVSGSANSSLNRRFINIADIGLGGFVTQEMLKNDNKFLSGKIKYALAILKGMIYYSKPEVIVEGDYKFKGKVLTLAICNSSFFGYGLCIAPEANIHDEKLNITCIGNVTLIDYFKNLGKIKRGLLISHPKIDYSFIQNIKVLHTNKPCPIEVDGEFIGHTPVEIKILPKALKFLLP